MAKLYKKIKDLIFKFEYILNKNVRKQRIEDLNLQLFSN